MSDIPLPGGGTLKLWPSVYSPQQIEAAIGKGPMIQNGTWWLWDVATMKYWDTGYSLADGLGPGSVTTPMLADGSVTWPKLAAEARPERRQLLDNARWDNPDAIVDQRGGYIIPAGEPYYQYINGNNQLIGTLAKTVKVTHFIGNAISGNPAFSLNGEVYYSNPGSAVRGYCESGYTIDRWYFYAPKVGSTITLSANGIVLENTGIATECQLIQRLPLSSLQSGSNNCFSVLADGELFSVTGQVSGNFIHPTYTPWGEIQFRKLEGVQYVEVVIWLRGVKSLKLTAAKLELGPYQTLAHESAGGGS